MSALQEGASAQTTDATVTDIWSRDMNIGSAFAIVHVKFDVPLSGTEEQHTFTLQGVKTLIESAHLVVTEAIHQTGSTGTPTPTVVFALDGSDNMVLRVTGAAATTVEWRAFVVSLTSD